jgi:hypothetical protein
MEFKKRTHVGLPKVDVVHEEISQRRVQFNVELQTGWDAHYPLQQLLQAWYQDLRKNETSVLFKNKKNIETFHHAKLPH